MKTRVISGAVLVVIGLVTIWLGGPVLMATLLFCAEVGLMEYYRACGLIGREKKIPGMAVAAFAGTAVYYCLLLTGLKNHYGVIASLVLVVVLMCYVGAFPKYRAEQAAEAGFGFFWVAVMLSYIFLIRDERDGLLNVWLVFLSSWVADTGAYFVGRACGKHKMTPLLSPHKTIEGAVGGILCAGLSGILFKALVGLLAGLWPTVFVNSDAHMGSLRVSDQARQSYQGLWKTDSGTRRHSGSLRQRYFHGADYLFPDTASSCQSLTQTGGSGRELWRYIAFEMAHSNPHILSACSYS